MADFGLFALRIAIALAIFSVTCFSRHARAAEGDWPTWRYDACRSAASPVELPSPLHLQWKRELPAPRPAFPNDPRLCFDVSYEPVVLGKRIFVPSMVTDSVTALETDTGEPIWTFFADAPVRLAPVAWDDRVAFVSDDGCLYCLSAADGRLLWKLSAPAPDRAAYRLLGNERLISRWPARGGPVLAHGTIYFAAGIWPFEGVFVCAVDAGTGKPVWVNRDAGFVKEGLLDHGTRRDGGLSPQGYLAVIGGRLVVPSGRALPGFFDRESGQMEPYTTGWGGRVALAKGCWYVCGTDDYLFQSGDVYGLTPPRPPDGPTPKPDELVSLGEFARRMDVPPETVDRWVKEAGLETLEQEGERFLRIRSGDPITYLSWWTNPPRPGELHALATRPRLQVDPANVKELGAFREPVVTAGAIYYSCPRSDSTKRIQDEDRRPPGAPDYQQIVASNVTGPPRWEVTYQGGWGGRLVEWRVARFDERWSLASGLKVHIKAGERLYAGGLGTVAAVDLPPADQKPKVSWQTEIEGTPNRMLAADGKLFVVTREGALYCFGGRKVEPTTFVQATDRPRAEAESDSWTTKAEGILKRVGVREGYCLALGLGSGRLVEELARQTELDVIAIDADPEKVDAARRKLHEMGLYGSRVHVVPGDLASLRLPPFLAGLVVSEDLARSGFDEGTAALERLYALLRPYGGVACLPISEDRHAALGEQVQQVKPAGVEVTRWEGLTLLARAGALPDSADWPHESGGAAHTFSSQDRHARPPFGVLWFGGGLDRVIPLLQGPPPRIAAGRMFLRVDNDLHAADIYTGRHLWKQTLMAPGDFVAAEEALYVVSGKTCLRLDPATGAPAGEIAVPREVAGEKGPGWQQIRIGGDSLIGTAGKHLVCVDRQRGELRWKFSSERDGLGFAVGADRVFCVDFWLPAHRRRAEPRTEQGAIYALDVQTGKPLWQIPAATPLDEEARKSQPSYSPFLDPELAFCEAGDVLVLTQNQSTAAAYRGATGELLWSREIPCKDPPGAFTGHRPPILLADRLISHGGEAIELLTGTPCPTRMWKGMNAELRGCGRALGGPNFVTVRDGHASYFDLATGGHVYFRGIRSGCTNSLIAAGGILNAPNYARHCTCNWPLSVSLALTTTPEAPAWDPARSDASGR